MFRLNTAQSLAALERPTLLGDILEADIWFCLRATIDGLRQQGATEPALARCIIVEFGEENSAFDAALIGEYIKGEKRIHWTHFGPEYT